MGDLLSSKSNSSSSSNTTTNQQQGIQVGSGQAATLGTNATGNSIVINNSDAGTIANALNTVNLAVTGTNDTANNAIAYANYDTVTALHTLETLTAQQNSTVNNATLAAQTVASNAQQLAYNQPTQSIGTNGGLTSTQLSVALGLLGVLITVYFASKHK